MSDSMPVHQHPQADLHSPQPEEVTELSSEKTVAQVLKHAPGKALSPSQVLQLQRTIGNAAVQRLMTPISSVSGPVMQRGLDPVKRRLRRDGSNNVIENTWKKMLRENGYSALDVKKLDTPANDLYFTQQYTDIYQIDLQFDGHLGTTPKKKQKARDRLKDRIEAVYWKTLNQAEIRLDDLNDLYDRCITQTVDAIKTYYTVGPRLNAQGKKIGNPKMITYELTNNLPPLIKPFYNNALHWLTDDKFVQEAIDKYKLALQPVPALSAAEKTQLADEMTRVNNQLTAWATVVYVNKHNKGQGVNDEGTWGTSATGSVNFQHTPLTANVWNRLRKWWIRKPDSYVTDSLTTPWSLKQDRNPAVAGLSPRFNYHIRPA